VSLSQYEDILQDIENIAAMEEYNEFAPSLPNMVCIVEGHQ